MAKHSGNPDPNILSEHLKETRKRLGLNTYDIARGASISEGMVRALESGTVKSPGFHIMLRIAHYLGEDPYSFTELREVALSEAATSFERMNQIDDRIADLQTELDARLQRLERRAGFAPPMEKQ